MYIVPHDRMFVPHDRMYLWRNCCRMTHLMSNKRDLSEIRLQRLDTHIALQYVPHMLRFKSILRAAHWSVGRVLRLKSIWGKRTDRTTSFGCHIAFMFPWMRAFFFVCTLKRLSAFCYAHCCHIKCFSYKTIHEEYFPTKNDNYLDVHEKPEHIAIIAPNVPHGWFCT